MEPAPPSAEAEEEPAADGEKVVQVNGVDYLVDLETFVVMSLSEEPEEVGIWNDEANKIEFFDDEEGEPEVAVAAPAAPAPAAPAPVEPEPEPEPEPPPPQPAAAAGGSVTKIIEEDDDNLEVEVGGKAYLVDKMNFLVFPLDDASAQAIHQLLVMNRPILDRLLVVAGGWRTR